MLRLILGRAGSGKTAKIMDEISSGAAAGKKGLLLLVPEQYSHEAERELCAVCGDTLSLHAEVVSFTGLARRYEAEFGSGAGLLDKGGRLLAMTLAVRAVSSRLRTFAAAARRPELIKSLLDAVTELKSECITETELDQASERCFGPLGDKLYDMSVILGAYNAVVASGGADPQDRMARLSELILRGGALLEHIYIDGFTDFTANELGVIAALMKRGVATTVCLTCHGLNEGAEPFELPRRTALRLIAMASAAGIDHSVEIAEEEPQKCAAMKTIERHVFEYAAGHFEDGGAVTLSYAESVPAECEAAAGKVLELVQEKGCRYKDIAVSVRGFEEYRPYLESVFEYYGIPLFLSRRSDITQRAVGALIASAFEIISGGWACDAVLGYVKTGLAGLSPSECDILSNYASMWNIRGGMWSKREDLRLHPDGYGHKFDEAAEERLLRINELRRRAAAPLYALQSRGKKAATARAQAMALYEFIKDISLPEQFQERAARLRESGSAAAGEYVQMWGVVKNALEQCVAILGDANLEQEEFGKLFCLVLASYDIGTIPLSLDSVHAGDMDRMRRRHIKHLLILGASDERLPQMDESAGVFTAEDRERLLEYGLDMGGGATDVFCRELGLIYNCLTLPGETVAVSYCTRTAEGGAARPSFLISRLKALFEKDVSETDLTDARLRAARPAYELAAGAVRNPKNPACAAANEFFMREPEGEKGLSKIRAAANVRRGALSERSVRALYGDRLRLSASRVEVFSSCRFKYFMQYGIKARPQVKAGFDPPEMGSFMHFVLERVAREIMARGGFKSVSVEETDALTDRYIGEYVRDTLDNFREKSSRFVYLFRRLARHCREVVADMAEELRRSDFVPLDFELDFSGEADLAELTKGEAEGKLFITGVADRVDGFVSGEKLYIRVVDYKTGKKTFGLSDVLYGMGLQMPLYLFYLAGTASERYGREIVPAGILYVPARSVILKSGGRTTDEELRESRQKGRRRSGLILNDPEIIRAMEHGDSPVYLPVTAGRDGTAKGDSLATYGQLLSLGRYIDEKLADFARELAGGSIDADPYFRSPSDEACALCDYCDACHFDEGSERRRYLPKLKPAEVWELLEGGRGNG